MAIALPEQKLQVIARAIKPELFASFSLSVLYHRWLNFKRGSYIEFESRPALYIELSLAL